MKLIEQRIVGTEYMIQFRDDELSQLVRLLGSIVPGQCDTLNLSNMYEWLRRVRRGDACEGEISQ